MDEAEKYKQRLEAIAEKRRQQEEQDKARREMEDEKLRLQQLKRKSLRDQWLSEAAPLSPTSKDAQVPRSPPWDTQTQDIKSSILLQSGHQQLAEEEEKLDEATEAGQTEEVAVAEDTAEMIQDVVQNGENPDRTETAEDKVTVNLNSAPDQTASVSVNGPELEADTSHSTSMQNGQSSTNGPVEATAGAVDVKLEQQLSADEPEPGHAPNYDNNEDEEEEEGTLVMRAECVIITDEGDDASQEDHQEFVQPLNEIPSQNTEEGKEGGEAAEEILKTETAPETFTESEKSEAAEPTTEAQPAAENGDIDCSTESHTNGDGETEVEGQDVELEEITSVQLQPSSSALEGTTVALVPVYSEAQPSALSPAPQAAGETSGAPEGADTAVKAEEPACQSGQFQDVSLADPQENHRTEEGPGEQEPLLLEVKGPAAAATAEPAGVRGPASVETQSPPRAQSQGDESKAPKRKTCQCCSVM